MKIELPHIGYTVIVKQRKAYPGRDSSFALCERTDLNTSTIYIETPVPRKRDSTLAHELTHVLRNICEDRDMYFQEEREHMAYIMQYLMNRILGYKYKR